MSEPTKEEILDTVHEAFDRMMKRDRDNYLWGEELHRVEQAIRRLVEDMGEWQEAAKNIPLEGKDLVSLVNSIGLSLKLISKIRDFDFRKKGE